MNTVLLIAFAALACAQPVTINFLPQDLIEKRLHAYTTKNAMREPAMNALFEEAGCYKLLIAYLTVIDQKPD